MALEDIIGIGPENSDAAALLLQMLRQYGLESLAPQVMKFLQEGYGPDSVTYLLEQTPEYKTRFVANEARRQKGLPVLSPREYIETERAYRAIMNSAGLPEGYYDSPDDFRRFLEEDKSPQEIKSRVDIAVQHAQNMDEAQKQTFLSYYGIGERELAAYMLNPDRALPTIERISKNVQLGSEALRQGYTVDLSRAEYLTQGFEGPIKETVQQVAEALPRAQELSGIYGKSYDTTQKDLEEAAFKGLASAKRKKEKLAEREKSEFSGTGGTKSGSLSRPSGGY
jgi:hypothetical protein